MTLITQSEFARLAGVSKQAVQQAIRDRNISAVQDGRHRKINLDNRLTQTYLKASTPERDIYKAIGGYKKKVKDKQSKIMSFPGQKKKGKETVDKQNEELQADVITFDNNANDNEEAKLRLKYLVARAEREQQMAIERRLKNAKTRGDLLDREAVYKIFLYLDRVHSNLERLSSSYLNDIGGDIITAGRVTPEIDEAWRTAVLEQIDDAKKEIMKKLKEIDKEQARG